MESTVDLLHGKIVLVTGGSRRVGQAVAVALAKVGAKVAVNFKTYAAYYGIFQFHLGETGLPLQQ